MAFYVEGPQGHRAVALNLAEVQRLIREHLDATGAGDVPVCLTPHQTPQGTLSHLSAGTDNRLYRVSPLGHPTVVAGRTAALHLN